MYKYCIQVSVSLCRSLGPEADCSCVLDIPAMFVVEAGDHDKLIAESTISTKECAATLVHAVVAEGLAMQHWLTCHTVLVPCRATIRPATMAIVEHID